MTTLNATVKMNLLKTTKGTVVYAAASAKDGEVLRQQYIQNEAFNGATPPEHIEVTIKAI